MKNFQHFKVLIALSTIVIFSLFKPMESLAQEPIIPAAERTEAYIPSLKGKTVGVFANHTSLVQNKHLIDHLRDNGIAVKKIFAPEHGFRGEAAAGEKIDNTIDRTTGIPVLSLYGKKKRPTPEDLEGIDILLFDIQDVGVRFYTYISSLEEYMLSAIEADKPLMVLDRPNPNGFYIDGPVLEKPYRSFVGMQPVPVVYGMTIGEYARMILGENWLDPAILAKRGKNFRLDVIPCAGYTHQSRYSLAVAPSPNLPDMSAIYWYPSTCFFEGTVLSEGRGTEKPFQIFGHPELPKHLYSFTPQKKPGSGVPKLAGKRCYGWNISDSPDEVFKKVDNRLQLKWLLDAYKLFPNKKEFFLSPTPGTPAYASAGGNPTAYFFNKLAGNSTLMAQIRAGKSEEAIRKSWQPAIQKFKAIRQKYLIYP